MHTYFTTAEIRFVSVNGIDGCTYLDKPDDFKHKQQHDPITFSDEVDRIYLETEAGYLIRDNQLHRTIRITKTGSASTIVWNPWQQRIAAMGDMGKNSYLTMLCVEGANAADDRVAIQPGSTHRLSVQYSIEHPAR